MKDIMDFIVNYYELFSLLIALISVIITSFLTFYIYKQTQKTNKQQKEFEEIYNEERSRQQTKQLKIEAFPYKREVYKHLFAILELCNQMNDNFLKVDLKSLSSKQIKEFIEILLKQYVPDFKSSMWTLREAEYLFPKNIAETILHIRNSFDKMVSALLVSYQLEDMFSKLEISEEIENTKKANIDIAIKECKNIIEHTNFIEALVPNELDISNIYR